MHNILSNKMAILFNKLMKGLIKMRTWETELVIVKEVDFDHDLHAFEVYNKEGELLGAITPDSIEDMEQIITDLNNGDCPIENSWEDGMGNVCSMDGWVHQ